MKEVEFKIIERALEYAYEQGVVSDDEIDLAYDALPDVDS